MAGSTFDDGSHFGDGTDWIDHEPPFADPVIRAEFAMALGLFVLLFNEADYFVGKILRGELKRTGRLHLYNPAHDFASRLSLVEAIAPAADNLRGLPFQSLRDLKALRNTLAHGHFDQNPFGGDYKLILREKYRALSTASVVNATSSLGNMVAQLKTAHVIYDFL